MESTAQSLVGNVGQLLSGEYRLLSGVGGEVAELRDDLATMNALLRMQSEADEGAVDHFIREWMKQVRELAYDAEDCVDHYKLRVKSRPNDGMRAWLRRLLETLLLRRRLAGEIAVLRTRAITISDRHARYGVHSEALRRSPSQLPAGPSMLVASASSVLALRRTSDPEHRVVGIDGQAKSMAELVKTSAEKERHLKVFSIVGFGGVGKTTLAMEVCRRLEPEFPYQAMVSVSQAFEPSRDLKALLKRIFEQIVKPKIDDGEGVKEERPLDGMDGLDADKLAEKLKESLKDKRYLIVIDDVWTIRAWESIQSKLPRNNSQEGRIIMTTRIETIANTCCPASASGHYIHRMEPLKLEDSKKLFLSRVFGSEEASYPEELGDVMDNILKKCGGLPFAIVSIASVLAGYSSSGSKDKWETICRSIGSQMESNPTLEGMKHIITLSFNHLPHELKICMMYLSVFPEDYVIKKDRLVSRWIAEGLVPEKRGLSLKEVAESYVEELASRNMIEPRIGYNGKIKSCRVHDMLLEVMVSKSLESNFVSLLGGQYTGMSYDRIRRLSIQGDDTSSQGLKDSPFKKERTGHVIDWMDVKHVRSLSMFQHKGQKLLDHLDKFTLLRVLDVEDCEGLTDNHMRCICRLYLLKFLSLKGTNISEVPPQVEKLEHLQTFDVRGTMIRGLPETVTNLDKLERLMFAYRHMWIYMWRLPKRLSRMKALREVTNALLENDVQVAQEIGELKQLHKVSLYIDSKEIEYNNEVLKELVNSLSKAYSLRSLDIGNIDRTGTVEFLHDLPTPPRLLQYLWIRGGIGGRLPNWIESLTYLVRVVLSWPCLSGDEPYCVLCKLPNLKSIRMDGLYYSGDELIARTNHNFPALVSLEMVRNVSEYPMPRVVRFEEGSMSTLEKLQFQFNSCEKSFEGIEHLTNLKEVLIMGRKDNPYLDRALEQFKAESRRRPEASQFQVVVKYYGLN